jgi:hypothetical protein
MAQIPQYEDHVIAQGEVQRNRPMASAEDFGSQIGSGMDRIGQGLAQGADMLQQQAETEDVTNVHVNMMKARADWTQNLQDRLASAQPGDQTFAPSIMADVNAYVTNGADSAATNKGKQLWTQLGASLSTEFAEKAITGQSQLNGQAAANAHTALTTSATSTVASDPSQLALVQAAGTAAINDPSGQYYYPGVNQAERDRFAQDFINKTNFVAAKRTFDLNAGRALGILGPAAAAHDPGPALVQAGAVPGGQVSLSPTTMAQAPQVFPAAAATGANANVVLGQIDVGGAAGRTPEQMAVNQAALLKYYNGDQQMALAADHAGTDAVDAAVNTYGFGWAAHVPDATNSYVNSVMTVSGMTPSAPVPVDPNAAPAPAPGPTPVTQSSIPGWNGLTGEQQMSLVQYGTELNLRNMAEKRRQDEDARIDLAKQQEDKLTDVVKDFIATGRMDLKGIAADPNSPLKAQQLEWLGQVRDRAADHNGALADRDNPWVARNLMMDMTNPNPQFDHSQDVPKVRAAMANGSITANTGERYIAYAGHLKDDDGNPFWKGYGQLSNTVRQGFEKNPGAFADPSAYLMGWYSWDRDAQNQIAAVQKAGGDAGALLDPKSRDYLGKPDRIASFLPNASAVVANQAAAVVGPAKASLPTFKDFDSLAPGAQFTDPQGNVLRKKAPVKAAGVTGSFNLGGQ